MSTGDLERNAPPAKPGWLFWVVSALLLLWNLGGAYDWVSFMTARDAYIAAAESAAPEAAVYLQSMPVWRTVLWTIGIWFSVLGAVLLLLRRGIALPAFLISLAGIVGGVVTDFVLLDGGTLYAGMRGIFSVIVIVVVVFEIWWSRLWKGRRVLH